MSGRRTSPAKRQLPSAFAGPSSRGSGWPIRRPLAVCRSGGLLGGERSAASSASSPKVKVRPRFITKPSAVSHSFGSTFQRSAAAPTSIARATAAAWRSGPLSNARTDVESAVIRLCLRPSLFLRQRIGVSLGQRRGLDSDAVPCGAELVGDDLRQRGPYALTRLGLRDSDGDSAGAADLDDNCRTPPRLFP